MIPGPMHNLMILPEILFIVGAVMSSPFTTVWLGWWGIGLSAAIGVMLYGIGVMYQGWVLRDSGEPPINFPGTTTEDHRRSDDE